MIFMFEVRWNMDTLFSILPLPQMWMSRTGQSSVGHLADELVILKVAYKKYNLVNSLKIFKFLEGQAEIFNNKTETNLFVTHATSL